MTWPSARVAVDEMEAPAPGSWLDLIDAPGLAAGIGPELSRLVGTRISGRLAGGGAPLAGGSAAGPFVAVGQLRVSGGAGPQLLDLMLGAAGAEALIEHLFGSRPAAGATGAGFAPALASLPPGSGSWATLCRFLTSAASRAMAAIGHAVAGAPLLPQRAIAAEVAPGATLIDLELDIDGAVTRLLLVDPSTPALPPPPVQATAPDLPAWRERARARAFALDLPVTLRLADQRMPVAEVAALRAGDIIPLTPPQMLSVLVGGKRFADVPATRFSPEGQDR